MILSWISWHLVFFLKPQLLGQTIVWESQLSFKWFQRKAQHYDLSVHKMFKNQRQIKKYNIYIKKSHDFNWFNCYGKLDPWFFEHLDCCFIAICLPNHTSGPGCLLVLLRAMQKSNYASLGLQCSFKKCFVIICLWEFYSKFQV